MCLPRDGEIVKSVYDVKAHEWFCDACVRVEKVWGGGSRGKRAICTVIPSYHKSFACFMRWSLLV